MKQVPPNGRLLDTYSRFLSVQYLHHLNEYPGGMLIQFANDTKLRDSAKV